MSQPRATSQLRRQARGAASVELIGVLPALLLAVLIAVQLGAAGFALWSAALSARAGARAAAVGGDVDGVAERALPSLLRPGARITGRGPVAVSVAVPRVLPFLPRLEVGARSGLLPEAGGG
jgi:hypothetical protein